MQTANCLISPNSELNQAFPYLLYYAKERISGAQLRSMLL